MTPVWLTQQASLTLQVVAPHLAPVVGPDMSTAMARSWATARSSGVRRAAAAAGDSAAAAGAAGSAAAAVAAGADGRRQILLRQRHQLGVGARTAGDERDREEEAE
jgi:hypothetical protein